MNCVDEHKHGGQGKYVYDGQRGKREQKEKKRRRPTKERLDQEGAGRAGIVLCIVIFTVRAYTLYAYLPGNLLIKIVFGPWRLDRQRPTRARRTYISIHD